MNVHAQVPVTGRVVRDRCGRRVGRIVAVDYAATGSSEAWYLVRLAWTRGDYRAVPAAVARWEPGPSRDRAAVRLSLGRDTVRASPPLVRASRRAGLRREVLIGYYGEQSTAAR